MSAKHIGILALQGAFEAHRQKVIDLGSSAILVKTAADLKAVQGLILPGGESSTMLKLMTPELKDEIVRFCGSGGATLSTCAGTILLAKQVTNPEQHSLKVVDIDVVRNGYGRQIDSFVSPSISLSDAGKSVLGDVALEGVFIRAPQISRCGNDVTVLATEGAEKRPVLTQSGNVLCATFHPELGQGKSALHRHFLSLVPGI
jgi:5'-phosphate synthase pdxT subunit